jgi:hypothetical protein
MRMLLRVIAVSVAVVFILAWSRILPSLAIQFIMFEIFAGSVYAASGNIAAIALVESAWLGWTIALTMPITIML